MRLSMCGSSSMTTRVGACSESSGTAFPAVISPPADAGPSRQHRLLITQYGRPSSFAPEGRNRKVVKKEGVVSNSPVGDRTREYGNLEVAFEEGLAIITVDRPDTRNALDATTVDEL